MIRIISDRYGNHDFLEFPNRYRIFVKRCIRCFETKDVLEGEENNTCKTIPIQHPRILNVLRHYQFG
ncbi:MAG: hypothetical protein GWN01_13520 [Nitrosopumilaceae archaeon]|nr:hypothetical protein [Nitrosopumilaceae archaeon]NIU01883.1 hypothetical protein [Nitrosopumilaceae archaeon]NIU88287.1 hypothetical protein [Nitrosopumilaceae archaeon]NIV66579.1 hypothetical protein [Nitrosopumilaceae archaeon]NIX62484.1 hypothetical protein [Nitrosopumilaceae archaeon]